MLIISSVSFYLIYAFNIILSTHAYMSTLNHGKLIKLKTYKNGPYIYECKGFYILIFQEYCYGTDGSPSMIL